MAKIKKTIQGLPYGSLIRVFRAKFKKGWAEGYLVGKGPKFFVIHLVDGGVRLDGFNCMRYKDVTALEAPAPHADFMDRVLELREQKVAEAPLPVDLSSRGALIRTAGLAYPVITLYLEKANPDACYIGKVLSVDDKRVRIRCILPGGVWDDEEDSYRLSKITRVDFGGSYEDALVLYAGGGDKPMRDPFAPRIGGTLSADIAVPEHEREVRFYARVLGTGESPLWREDLMNNRGMPVIGLGARSPEYAVLPLQWMPHIQVADVAASVGRALELGGAELMHGKDDEGESQWAVLRDPNGAAFGLIPVVPAEALPVAEDAFSDDASSHDASVPTGCIAWLDLAVPDAAATRDFYCQVIGWSVQDVPREDAGEHYTEYDMLAADGTPAAGICHARGAMRELPPVWLICLPVGDLAESLRRVEEEGGKVLVETPATAGARASAVIQDPVGACLALVSFP